MRACVLRAVVLGLLPTVVAAVLWRLERDRPPWLEWRASPITTRVPAGALPLPRGLVLAVHYPWYGTPQGPTGRWRHWNHARLGMPEGRVLGFHDPGRLAAVGRLDIGATHYPEGGPYDSRDPTRIRAQLGLTLRAGLNGLLVSWWGRESEDALLLGDLLRHAGETGLVVAPYYETGELWPRGAAGVAADFVALLDRHGREPAWLRVGGVPVVFVYAAHRLRPAVWDAVLARVAATGRRLYLIAEVPSPRWLDTRPDWLSRFDAFHVYTPIPYLARGEDLGGVYRALAAHGRAAARPFIPAVAPGFDDRQVRTPGTVVDRADGATYDRTWTAALSVDPSWVLVSSWNEWHEGSELEPSVEHGYRYLDRTQAWATRFRQGRP